MCGIHLVIVTVQLARGQVEIIMAQRILKNTAAVLSAHAPEDLQCIQKMDLPSSDATDSSQSTHPTPVVIDQVDQRGWPVQVAYNAAVLGCRGHDGGKFTMKTR